MSQLLNIPRVSSRERWNLLAGQRVLLLTLTATICVNVCLGVRLAANPMPLAPLLPNLKKQAADDAAPAEAAARKAAAAAQIALGSIEQFDRLAADWRHRGEELLTSEEGRRIAADQSHVAAFVARFDRLQRDQVVADRITRSVQELLGSLSTASERGADAGVTPALMTRLDKVQTFADALVQSWRSAHEELDRWTRDDSPSAPCDLRTAVARLQARAASAPPATADGRVRRALLEEQLRRDAQLKKLEAECQTPRVLAVLRPFVTPGYRHDGGLHPHRRPYSLAYLQRIGAMNPTQAGYDSLVRAAVNSDAHASRWNALVRNNRVQPDQWSNEQVRLVRDAQAYLRKYGEALVSVGRLDP